MQTIYENDGQFRKKITIADRNTTRIQSSELTGNESVKMRSSRAALVCLVLLCFLLLTAVIVLSVLNYTNYTQERDQLLTRITNLTEENDQLRNRTTNLIEERNKIMIKSVNPNARIQLNNTLQTVDRWIYYQFSFYYVPYNTKNWNDSRRDCQKRGADLIIINNKEEQDFIMNMTSGKQCWIGLTDFDFEGSWKWVDGTNMTSGIWAFNSQYTEPNGGTNENCVVTYLKDVPILKGWIDEACSKSYQWICEKSISALMQP